MEIIIIKFTIHKDQKKKWKSNFEVCRKNIITRLQIGLGKLKIPRESYGQ